MATGFFDFLRKTNALALAVAVIIGAAIGKVVSSVVADLLMPVIGLFVGGGEWRTLQIPLRTGPDGTLDGQLLDGLPLQRVKRKSKDEVEGVGRRVYIVDPWHRQAGQVI